VTDTTPTHPGSLPSLTEGLAPGSNAARAVRRRGVLEPLGVALDRAGKPIGIALACAGLTVGAVLAWNRYGPVFPPDPLTAPIGDTLEFALLDADFNRLPLERRLALARDLARRLRTMDAGDSALLAAFAAGIAGRAREQLEANVSRLMVDLIDRAATRYTAAAPEDREATLRASLIEMIALRQELDPVGGAEAADPARSLDEMRRRAIERDRAQRPSSSTSIAPDEAADVLRRIGEGVAERTSPAQRARTVRFMRDTVRYLRGQDPATGERVRAPG